MQIARFSFVNDLLIRIYFLLNEFESQWSLFNNIFKCCIHTKTLFYIVSYFNMNRTKYSVLLELDIDLDLTEVFSLKKFHLTVQT